MPLKFFWDSFLRFQIQWYKNEVEWKRLEQRYWFNSIPILQFCVSFSYKLISISIIVTLLLSSIKIKFVFKIRSYLFYTPRCLNTSYSKILLQIRSNYIFFNIARFHSFRHFQLFFCYISMFMKIKMSKS